MVAFEGMNLPCLNLRSALFAPVASVARFSPLGAALFLFAAPLSAAEYTINLGSSSTEANWSDAVWTPAGPPGVGDSIHVTSAGNLYIETDRTLDVLRGSGNFRLRSGYKGVTGTSVDTKLTVGRIEAFLGNSFQFFDRSATSLLSVEAGSMLVGGSGNATMHIGQSAGNGGVSSFVVTGTTTIQNNSILHVNEIGSTDLGRLHFQSATNASHSPHVYLRTTNDGVGASYSIVVKSLSASVDEAPRAALRTGSNAQVTVKITGPGSAGVSNVYRYDGALDDSESGSIAIEKSGIDTQIFNRLDGNAYKGGTTINGGILAITNSTGSGLGTGAVSVGNGGTLAGRGRVELGTGNSVSVSAGGVITPAMPGETGFSTLTFSGAANGAAPILSMQSGAAFAFTLGSGNASDTVLFSSYTVGDLVLNDNVVNVTGISAGTYTLFEFRDGGGNAVASGLSSGLQLGSGFEGWHASFVYDNSAIYLQVVPEPSTAMLGLATVGTLVFLGLRKRGQ